MLLLCVAPAASVAEEAPLPDPLTVRDVVRLAESSRAEIVAARRRVAAAAQRPAIVSALEDPMLMLSADHIPFNGMGADASGMLQLNFPLSRVLGHRRRAAEAEARRAASDAGTTTLDVALEAVRAFYMLDERRRTLAVVDEQLALAQDIARVVNAHYAAGHGNLSEALRIQQEVARLEAERDGLRAEVQAAEAMLNASLNRPPPLPVPALRTTPRLETPAAPQTAIEAALGRRPELAAMRHARERALAEVDVMRAMYAPMAFVRGGAAYTMTDGPGAMIMLGLSLPVWRSRLRAGVAEARSMVDMANAEIQAMARMIEGQAAAIRHEIVSAQVRVVALSSRVVPLARESITAAIASYGAGRLPLVSVLDALRALLEARMQVIMSEVALGVAWARFERATATLGEGR